MRIYDRNLNGELVDEKTIEQQREESGSKRELNTTTIKPVKTVQNI